MKTPSTTIPRSTCCSNATYANNAAELVTVIREQFKEGADFIKIYETGRDSFRDGQFTTPYQYTEAELTAAVQEAARVGKRVAVHATGEPGTLYAARAGVASIDHAYQLSDETMRIMHEKQIFAVPTFTISEYFADHAGSPAADRAPAPAARFPCDRNFASSWRRACRWPSAPTSGPFPHGTQAREFVLDGEVRNDAAAVLQADLLNGAKIAGLAGPDRRAERGLLRGHYRGARQSAGGHQRHRKVSFVMKGGVVYRR